MVAADFDARPKRIQADPVISISDFFEADQANGLYRFLTQD